MYFMNRTIDLTPGTNQAKDRQSNRRACDAPGMDRSKSCELQDNLRALGNPALDTILTHIAMY